ncbi:MAG: hypothetical protein U0359_05720 [Byssovorax sp.]
MLPPRAFTLCCEWALRWLPDDPHLPALPGDTGDDAPGHGLDPLAWAAGWTDCAVREIVPLALDSLDLPGQAAALRLLPAIVGERAGLDAIGRLDLAAKTAAALGPKFHFCASARLAVQEVLILSRAAELGLGSLAEQLWRFESLFSESGALDMVIHRAISAGAPRDAVHEVLRARLAELAAMAAADRPLPAHDAEEHAAPRESWAAPIGAAHVPLARLG